MDEEHIFELKIDEVKTKTVERLIAPLVHMITSLHADYCPSGRSVQDGNLVLNRANDALIHFSNVGIKILQSHSFTVGKVWDQLKMALNNVQSTGQHFLEIGRDFVENPADGKLRDQIRISGRDTLMAVVKLLVMADMVDVDIIVQKLEKVRDRLEETNRTDNLQELLNTCTNLETELHELTEMTKRRLKDFRDPTVQDDLYAAVATLRMTAPIMISASKAYISYPELEALRNNRDYAYEEMNAALNTFKNIIHSENLPTQGQDGPAFSRQGRISELVINLEKFQCRAYMDPPEYRPNRHRPQLEEMLERIASGSAVIADLYNTRSARHDQIVNGVNNLRQALQDLLKEYENNVGRVEPTEDLDLSKVYLAHNVRDLRRFLRRAVVDHVSDAFLDTRTPLMILIGAASAGDIQATEIAAKEFISHSEKLIDVAQLVCDISSDIGAVRVLQYVVKTCEKVAPQVVHAAFLLSEKPDKPPIQENMSVFENLWLDRVKALTMTMDSLISVDDFLAVSESHISEDCQQGIQAIMERNGELLDRISGGIRGRSLRVCEVVLNEIDQMPHSQYSDAVKSVAHQLRQEILPTFVTRAERIVNDIIAVQNDKIPPETIDTNNCVDEMIDACQLIHDGVNSVRHALLMNRNPEDIDSDNEYEEEAGTTFVADTGDVRSQTSDGEIENQQKVMRQLPEESKKEIQKQIDVFKLTQRKFEYEVGKWDESGNDIIAIAKHMCHIMMNMMDFTKGRGPYRTTMDIIRASQEISDDGAKLNALSRQIGNECVESTTKKDLFAYLERITLFCHQLNVTSKVKADVQVVGDELKVSGLEAATSLIQNSKNLLNAVILTVKSGYIASTKYRRKESTRPNVVEWRMAPPQRYPVVHPALNTSGSRGIVRRASERKPPPVQTIAKYDEF